MNSLSVSEVRARLPELLDRVEAGEEVTITRHGRPIAVLVRQDALRARRADRALEAAASVRDALRAARERRLPSRASVSETRAEELIAEVRAGRRRR